MGFAGAGVNEAGRVKATGRAEEAASAEAGRGIAKGVYGTDAKEASSAPPAFPTTTGTTSDTEMVSRFDAYATHNPQEYAWFSGGRQLFENYDYATGNSRNYTLTLPCRSAGNAGSLTIGFSAANSTSTRVTPQFNGSSLGTPRPAVHMHVSTS